MAKYRNIFPYTFFEFHSFFFLIPVLCSDFHDSFVSCLQQIHSDSDEGDGSIKYTISGEGAGTIFIIDEITGDIHATERLDREEKTYYTLRAQARDRLTDQPLEPESEFIIKVQDINDSEPKFLEGPYIGSVPELSPIGKEVTFPIAYQVARASY